MTRLYDVSTPSSMVSMVPVVSGSTTHVSSSFLFSFMLKQQARPTAT